MHIYISIQDQTLTLTQANGDTRTYPVSTAKNGIGTEPNSYKTPTGNFTIAEKHGHDHHTHTAFCARKPTGTYDPANPQPDSDLILARILWLDGCDPDNANTKDRFIYIHGTNHETLIGTPASQGCIRMKKDDIVELFDLVPEHTPIHIA